ncbi:WecB/TagA/CpsF family glycosyltransferase [Lentibacillus saliphilus]|uniref:WecB/TagA/CpsF family glycosyltransferase n=1 Tax=Lentibacillus saliphilus TaxID=2737028 RepID=UPI001FE75812|nr:WecB/TagA/CpsF family glycosyltransferase [Lentibacillus saliphilus]
MNIHFLNTTKAKFITDFIFPRLESNEKCFIVTANPEIVMKAQEDSSYMDVIQSADYVIPDGSGIILASKLINKPLPERIPGFEIMMELLALAEKKGKSVYLLGAKKHVNEQAVREAKTAFPELKIAGHMHGFFDLDDEAVAHEVVRSGADIIFVALGMPRQEKWIAAHKDKFNHGVFMGVGGSFDVLAGEVKRAPKKWIDLNLEWLYRLLKQPFRIKRIFKVVEFMVRIIFTGKKQRDYHV